MITKPKKSLFSFLITTAIIAGSSIANAGIHIDVLPARVVHPVRRVVVVNPVRRVVVNRVVVANRPGPVRCTIKPGHWSHGVWISQHKNCWAV